MDDPKLIYPLYEKAQELGLKHVAVHKAVPPVLKATEPVGVPVPEVGATMAA